jgi:hypothetical protein
VIQAVSAGTEQRVSWAVAGRGQRWTASALLGADRLTSGLEWAT